MGLGSNLGDREATLRAARERLGALSGARLVAASPVYETEPWGDAAQPRYLNQVLALELDESWSPGRLLETLLAIEADLGRVRGPRRFGPRTLDLDILLYGERRIDDAPDLVVPHPRLRERAFVLAPLADIAPHAAIPDGQGGDVAEALSKIPFKIFGNSLITGD